MVYEVLFFKFGLKSRLYCTALIEFHSFSGLKPSEEIRALSSLSGMFLGEMAPPLKSRYTSLLQQSKHFPSLPQPALQP